MITVDYLQSIFSKLPPELLPIPGWFIAGGSACYELPTDIDLYFTSEAAFLAVKAVFTSVGRPDFTSDNAESYSYSKSSLSSTVFGDVRSFASGTKFQLIIRKFAPVADILADFDLNVCRKAILPDRSYVSLPESNHPLYLDLNHIRANSPQRLIKYLHRGFLSHTLRFEDLVHHLIANPDTLAEGCYDTVEQSYSQLLHRLYSYPPLASTIACIVDSYPLDVRQAIYSKLIKPSGCYLPDPSLSYDHQLATSSCTYSLPFATPAVRKSAPELFI